MSNIILPGAPGLYLPKDQNHIRRILERSVEDVLARLNTLETATPPVEPPDGSHILRVGMSGFGSGVIGLGPGDLAAPDPIFGVAGHYQPLLSDILQDIEDAQTHDVLLSVNLAGGRNSWTTDGGSCRIYDESLYNARIDRWTSEVQCPGCNDAIQGMVDQQKIVFMAVDEPNHPNFCDPSTISPTDMNNMGLYIKSKWPGAIVYVRTGKSTLVNSYSNVDGESSPPLGGWTGIDYGYTQYAWNNTQLGPGEATAIEKSEMATVDVGTIPGFNYIDSGPWQDADGVSHCWDYLHTGSSSGVINGGRGDAETPDGVQLACGDALIGTVGCRYLWGFPDWAKHYIDEVYNDSHWPFIGGFVYADAANNNIDQWARDLQQRADHVAAYQYMIAKGAERASWDGWRTIK